MQLPDDVVQTGSSPEFDAGSVPEALRTRHATAEGHWGVLHVLAGEVTWVDLRDDTATRILTGARHVIAPGVPHRIEVSPDARLRIDFFKERG